jgi:sterol desaturase/sphingolipid hydroxylase (fatty acid hydroxylase superfamily)
MSAPVSLQIVVGFLLFALVFVPLERWLPRRRQPIFRPGWGTDIAYYVLGCFVGKFSDALSLGALLLIRQGAALDLPKLAEIQPSWVQFLEILVIADFLAYLYHRSIHKIGWLWRLHRIHHNSRRLDWLANVRLHPIDKILGDCAQFIPIFCLGFADGPLLAYTIFLGFQGFLNHSNLKINFGPLRWIIASPEFHHWHHCNDPATYNRNFAPHLVIFDRLFGTAHLRPDRSFPQSYGVPEAMPAGIWRQLFSPLRRS